MKKTWKDLVRVPHCTQCMGRGWVASGGDWPVECDRCQKARQAAVEAAKKAFMEEKRK